MRNYIMRDCKDLKPRRKWKHTWRDALFSTLAFGLLVVLVWMMSA